MAENKEKVKVRLKVSTPHGKAGDVVEVSKEDAEHMTKVRQIQSGRNLVDYSVAEAHDAQKKGEEIDFSKLTVSELHEQGLKNVITTPKQRDAQEEEKPETVNPTGIQPGWAPSSVKEEDVKEESSKDSGKKKK